LFCAWILCSGRRSLTRVIQSAQLTGFKHYCSFHRFFSQARWNLDDLGRCVFQLLLDQCKLFKVAGCEGSILQQPVQNGPTSAHRREARQIAKTA